MLRGVSMAGKEDGRGGEGGVKGGEGGRRYRRTSAHECEHEKSNRPG